MNKITEKQITRKVYQPAKEVTVTVYVSTDNREHETLELAEQHQKKLDAHKQFEENNIFATQHLGDSILESTTYVAINTLDDIELCYQRYGRPYRKEHEIQKTGIYKVNCEYDYPYYILLENYGDTIRDTKEELDKLLRFLNGQK